MTKTYTLMNRDTPLASFALKDIAEDDFALEEIKVVSESPYASAKALTKLIHNRKPDQNRENMDKLLGLMRIKRMSEYLDISYGLSLNDTLWFRPVGADDDICWDKLNLYQNKFNETIAYYAFSGAFSNVFSEQSAAGMNIKAASPELGTGGMLPKCWVREGDTVFLYKGGTSGFSNTGNEPFSEYMASALLDAMDMPNYVKYSLKKYHNHLVSSCELFTTMDYGFIPVCGMFNPELFDDVAEAFDDLKLRAEFNDLMVFDALIWNPDRHLNNYGFIIDNATFEIQGMAPVFDNGEGLLPYYTMDKNIEDYSVKYDIQNSGLSFEAVLARCLEDSHKKTLGRLDGFRFPSDPLLGLSAERIERIEALLQKRIRWLCSLPIL